MFDQAYRDAKRERNVLDFNDLEHLALEVLYVREETGTGEERVSVIRPRWQTSSAGSMRRYWWIGIPGQQLCPGSIDHQHFQGAVRLSQRIYGGGCEAEHIQVPSGQAGAFWINMKNIPGRADRTK